ncbi:MAG TPA: type II CAAX endopeptidase family protein [Candidatus Limnocylindrales bacterium]
MSVEPSATASSGIDRGSGSPLRQAGWFVGLSLSLVIAGVVLAPVVGPALPFLLALGPGVIAIVLAWREGSLRRLLGSVTRRPTRARSYLVLLVPFLGSLVVVPVAMLLGIATTGPFGSLTPTAVILPLVVFLPALAEELGWRGYALPRVMTRTSPLVASLVLAVPWAAMHLALYLPDQMYAGQQVWPSIVTVFSLSVLGTWVYLGTGGSVLMTTLFHAGYNAATPLTWAVDADAAWAIRPVIFAVTAVAVVLLGGLRSPDGTRVARSGHARQATMMARQTEAQDG